MIKIAVYLLSFLVAINFIIPLVFKIPEKKMRVARVLVVALISPLLFMAVSEHKGYLRSPDDLKRIMMISLAVIIGLIGSLYVRKIKNDG